MVFFLRRKGKGGPASKDALPRDRSSSNRFDSAKDQRKPKKTANRPPKSDSALEKKGSAVRETPTPLQDPSVIRLADRMEAARAEDDSAVVPSFRLPASSISVGSMASGGVITAEALRKLRNAFTPSRPKRSSRLFTGRFDELSRVISAIEEERAHVVIYAERGRGKTSMANIISEVGEDAGYLVLRYSCNSSITFEDIFRSLLREIPMSTIGVGASDENLKDRNYESLLPPGNFGATELSKALRHLTHLHVIFLIDEFDRVYDENLKNQIAESIKNLSDVSANVTFVILGVAHNLEELLGKHPSIQRNIIGVLLPPMRADDIRRLVDEASKEAGIRFEEETCEVIITLSKGLPYYAQLLCLHGGRLALERGATIVEKRDVEGALDRVLAESDRLVIEIYERVTEGGRNQFQKDVLFAAAFCDADQYDTFTAADAARVFENSNDEIHLLALQKALSVLSTEEKGPVLRRFAEPSGMRYGFANQTMRQYVLVRQALERGLFD